MSFHSSRRAFLATTSLTAVESMLASRQPHSWIWPLRSTSSSVSAAELLPEPIPAPGLHLLATTAVDAATQAGASYADIRIAERHALRLLFFPDRPVTPTTQLESICTYGIRVIVDGACAFVHGVTPSIDAVTASTRNAIAVARGYARFKRQAVEMASVPKATGAWETPCQIDPFTVPLEDQAALLYAYVTAATRVHRGDVGGWPQFYWTRETRVFASSDGALTTQRFRRSTPMFEVAGDGGMGAVNLQLRYVGPMSGGYETVLVPGLQDQIKARTEQAVELASLPRGTMDVGRYPIVLDGVTLGSAFSRTVGQALELDRVLGEEADASGTSFLAPPAAMLGNSIVSPLLTVTGHRTFPTVSTVRWDDEGVVPQPFPMITQGRLMNYCTSRQTVTHLRQRSAPQEGLAAPQGCTVAPDAGYPVLIRVPHIAIMPATTSATIADLYKGIARGILVCGASHITTDQQLTSGNLTFGGIMLEVVNGKIVRRLRGNGIQFNTARLWKSLVSLGDRTTLEEPAIDVHKGQPWRPTWQSATAPAGLLKDVNVISTKIHV